MPSQQDGNKTRALQMINAFEMAGGVAGIVKSSKLRIEFQDAKDKYGEPRCRLMATMHLDELNSDVYAFAVNALSSNKDVYIEFAGKDGGQMNHALLIKTLNENYLNNTDLQNDARQYAIKSIATSLHDEYKSLRRGINKGISGEHPFDRSGKGSTSSIVDKFIKKVTGRNVSPQPASVEMKL